MQSLCSSRRPAHGLLVLLVLFGTVLSAMARGASNSTTLKVGALLAMDSIIGRVAKEALQLAVADINAHTSVLNSSSVALHMLDTNCSAFQGAAAAIELLKTQVVAVVGPQSTAVAHFVAYMAGATQVPHLTFASTDPALSQFQYPYLFRLAHSDATQMAAIASLISNYGWREVVVLFSDDDFGSNAAIVLDYALEQVVQKVALPPDISNTGIGSILSQLAARQIRIFVVHMPQSLAFVLFSEAKYLGMMSAGYAWIVTDSVLGTLESMRPDANTLKSLNGVVGLRRHYLNSPNYQSFMSKWKARESSTQLTSQPNIYALYAYDAMWMIAYALDSYIKDGFNFAFEGPSIQASAPGGTSELAQLMILKGGQIIRKKLLDTKFDGVSSLIQVNPKGDLIVSAFEIVNMIGEELHVVGYWTNETQIVLSPPEGLSNIISTSFAEKGPQGVTLHIVWPGDTIETPRGWVLPQNGRPLRIAVPRKSGFRQFVSQSSNSIKSTSFHGFCIDVFENALKHLPYDVSYKFVSYGNGTTPVYDEMIGLLADKVFDAVVGDLTITTKRVEKVDFTQPYSESGLVVVVPTKDVQSDHTWAFLRPFTWEMWLTTLAFFILTGAVVWMLEHKVNRDFRGHPKKQVVTILWFTFSTLFFSQSEKIISTLGRFVVIIWLFVVLIIISSYTASLTSILTVQQLIPTINGISSLQASDVPIGYQTGSFVKDYLISLKIAEERLKPLPSMAAYANALHLGPQRGGVAAIVDELPYIEVFLGTQCGFTVAGQPFTKGGWGFAFPKHSEMAVDLSVAILTMSENGELQRVHDMWLMAEQCGSQETHVQSNQLALNSFWSLFLITGLASTTSILIYMVILFFRFSRISSSHPEGSESGSSSKMGAAVFFKSFASYFDEHIAVTSDETTKPKQKRSRNDSTEASNFGNNRNNVDHRSHVLP